MARDKYNGLSKVRNNEWWLVDREVLDLPTTKVNLGEAGMINGYEFGLSSEGAHVSQVKVPSL